MNRSFLLGLCLTITNILSAQDAYHTNLQNSLQNDYGLPVGTWVLNNSEAANLGSDFAYGDIQASELAASGQDFSQKVQIAVNSAGGSQWDAGYGINNVQTIGSGTTNLLVVWLRAVGGNGRVSLFVENSSTYEKEIYFTFDLATEWTRFLVPFDADQAYVPGGITVGLHLAWMQQTVEIGGLAVLNYGSLSINELPEEVNNDRYGGWEADAPWRAEAADRINQIRKAELTVRVEDENGNPVPDATVSVEMLQHEYAFGSAVVSRLFAGNNSHNPTYESKLLDLDGEGHGFNWVVFENALKWPGWENNWITTPPETAHAAEWLIDHDIKIRGHNLVWPGWSNLPGDIQANQNNHDYIRERIDSHIEEIVTYPGLAGNIAEWDVLNEITTNRDLEYAFQGQPGYPTGREIFVEIFEKLREIDPNTKTYLNDYVTISQNNTGGGLYDLKKQFAQELIDAGVQLDGIGFQGHIGGFPNSIYDVYNTLEDFYSTFGTTAKITEYDTNEAVNDELAATYLRDFLTIVFSHPSTDGFMTWGFWDGAHWHSNAPFFYQDWTIKPAGEAFIDLVYNEWWTEESGQTNSSGVFGLRGFKGKYKITIDSGDEVLVDTIQLHDDLTIVKRAGETTVDVTDLDMPVQIRVYPNPASDYLYFEKENSDPVQLQIFNALGQEVFSSLLRERRQAVSLNFGTGLYQLIFTKDGIKWSEKIVIE